MVAAIREYRIRLEGIRFRANHGVTDSERDLPQDFLVNAELSLPATVLPPSDQLKFVFDYDRVSSLVVQEGTKQNYLLLETLAQRLIDRLLAETPATRACVSIQKSRPPTKASVDSVSVELVGTRDGA